MMETKANGYYIVDFENDRIVDSKKISLSNRFSIKIDWFKFIKMIIFSKSNRHWLRYCIEYAMNREDEVCGEGASDVIVFENRFVKAIETIYKEDKEEN